MNGKSISMGCSEGHYCNPRGNFDDFEGDWESVELGYPNGFTGIDGLENVSGNCIQVIYAWVPIEKVIEWIRENGGLKIETQKPTT